MSQLKVTKWKTGKDATSTKKRQGISSGAAPAGRTENRRFKTTYVHGPANNAYVFG
jgi:hypothetical protein